MQIWSIDVYIHILADTYWDSCAIWWKLGFSGKLRFHFWWLATHMKMSIKFSPSKVLIKTFMGRSFLIHYLLPCIFCFYVRFFFSIWFRFSHWLNRHAAMTLDKLIMGLRHASRQDHTVLKQIGKKPIMSVHTFNLYV